MKRRQTRNLRVCKLRSAIEAAARFPTIVSDLAKNCILGCLNVHANFEGNRHDADAANYTVRLHVGTGNEIAPGSCVVSHHPNLGFNFGVAENHLPITYRLFSGCGDLT